MRVAKDGKPFDVDLIPGEAREDEVEVIQFLLPNARRRRMLAPVGKEYAEKADGLILSAELLKTGGLAFYARRIGEDEEKEKMEFAVNGPGPHSPTEVLRRLIDAFNKESKKGTKSSLPL